MVIAAQGQYGTLKISGKVPQCVEFGLRRSQGPDGGFSASKYCFVGGFSGTSNVQAGYLLGVDISGTHAHAFVQSYASLDEVKDLRVKKTKEKGSGMVTLLPLVLKYRDAMGGEWMETNDGELAAFTAYAVGFPHAFLCLVDTYDTIESGVKNFILVARALHDCGYTSRGIRLDSGDLAALSLECRRIFEHSAKEYNLPFFLDLNIVASNDINEKTLLELNTKGHAITVFGIGTNLVTCQAQPALGCVFKLVELNGEPRIKLSNEIEKVLIPGRKKAFRLFNFNGEPEMDLLIDVTDEIPKDGIETTCYNPFKKTHVKFTPGRVEELLSTVWNKKNGACGEILSLDEAKVKTKEQIKALKSDMLRPSNPLGYNVYTSKKLHDALHDLWESKKIRHTTQKK